MPGKFERYKKEIIEPRQNKPEGKMLSTREMRRRVKRGNMKPKTVQLREIHTTMIHNKNLINSLKQQIILSEQKIQVLQEEVSVILERLEIIENPRPPEPTEEEKSYKKYAKETHKLAIRGGKETDIYKKWKAKQ